MNSNDRMVETFKKKYQNMSSTERQDIINKYGISGADQMDEDTLATSIIKCIREKNRKEFDKKIKDKAVELKSSRFIQGGFGQRDLGAPDHWVDLTENRDFRITKPTIICLPGNGSITTRQANGFCGMVERLMGLKTTEGDVSSSYQYVDVLGFYYSTNSAEETVGDYNLEEIDDIINRILLPLCVDENGNRLTLDDACKNISLITFFSHCYGARAVNHLMTKFSEKLENNGYSSEEVFKLLGYSFQLTYSPYTDTHLVPTVELFSQTDSFHKGSDKEFFDKHGYYLDGIMYEYKEFNKNSNSLSNHDMIKIITSKLLNVAENRDMSNLIDEHTIMYLKRDDKWSLGPDSKGAKNADLFSIIAGYILSWSVVKSMDTSSSGALHNKHCLQELCPILDDLLKYYQPEELQK